jgi:hypothetical protein
MLNENKTAEVFCFILTKTRIDQTNTASIFRQMLQYVISKV